MTKERENETKKKDKLIKVLLRRLPSEMTFAELEKFLGAAVGNCVSFVPGDPRFAPHNFARCYFAFLDVEEVVAFANKFNRQMFIDAKGNESIAIVELAMFPKIPKNGRAQVGKDIKCGQIEDEVEYKKFLDELNATKQMVVLTLDEQIRYVREKEKTDQDSVMMDTPLTQYMIKKNEEKYKRIEEKRKDRRRGKSEKAESTKASHLRRDEKEDEADVQREDWEKFKRDLGIGGSKTKIEKINANKEDSGPKGRSEAPKSSIASASKRAETKPRVNTTEKEVRRPDRVFSRTAPRTERITAMTKEDKKVVKARPEREIYRPGQHRKAAAPVTSDDTAS